ncbi:MAG: penicillin-binding protein 2 [Planctomycetes bacterium RBG_16_43_13]|nr:MAG: penicillin-binding protein 2 [Planctomycetes bacterium RBG_16_43_13]
MLLIPIAGIEARLFYIQVIKGDDYRQSIQSTKKRIQLIPAPRGKILDRNGKTLALDDRAFELYLVLDDFEKDSRNIATLSNILRKSQGELSLEIAKINKKIENIAKRRPKDEWKKLYKREKRTPYLAFTNVNFYPEAVTIETHPELFSGVIIKQALKRTYPYGKTAAHILGYLGSAKVNEEEFNRLLKDGYFTEGFEDVIGEDGINSLVRRGNFDDELTGRSGLELIDDSILHGWPGLEIVERNLYAGEESAEKTILIPPKPGSDIQLTIDVDLQQRVEDAIQSIMGAAIVMDIKDGSILAIASNPTFDPNHFIPPTPRGINISQMYLNNKETRPMLNRAISGYYTPGSIFKVVTATAALEEKAITPETPFTCSGKFSPSYEHFNCWVYNRYQTGHGSGMTIHSGLQKSCNVFFFNAGKVTGPEGLLKWADALGFGKKTGIELPYESAASIPSLTSLPERRWGLADTLNISIGQGEISVTPIQMVRMMSAIANGGYLVKPHIIKDNVSSTTESTPPNDSTNNNITETQPIEKKEILSEQPLNLNIKQETLNAIREGLYAVVHEEGGTAHNTAIGGIDTAGKTGSAQTGGDKGSHAWFAGFTPYKEPRYAYVVIAEHGGSGAGVAAPVAANIVGYILEKEKK